MRNILCSRLLLGAFGVALSPMAGLVIKMLISQSVRLSIGISKKL